MLRVFSSVWELSCFRLCFSLACHAEDWSVQSVIMLFISLALKSSIYPISHYFLCYTWCHFVVSIIIVSNNHINVTGVIWRGARSCFTAERTAVAPADTTGRFCSLLFPVDKQECNIPADVFPCIFTGQMQKQLLFSLWCSGHHRAWPATPLRNLQKLNWFSPCIEQFLWVFLIHSAALFWFTSFLYL